MISIVLLDCMFYLSIFFIVGGYVASLFGKLTSPMLHSFFIYAFSGLLSYKLGRISGKPQLRFLAPAAIRACRIASGSLYPLRPLSPERSSFSTFPL